MLNKRYMDVLKNLDGNTSGNKVLWNEEYELAIRYAIDSLESNTNTKPTLSIDDNILKHFKGIVNCDTKIPFMFNEIDKTVLNYVYNCLMFVKLTNNFKNNFESTTRPVYETNNVDNGINNMYDDLMAKNSRNSFYGRYGNRFDNSYTQVLEKHLQQQNSQQQMMMQQYQQQMMMQPQYGYQQQMMHQSVNPNLHAYNMYPNPHKNIHNTIPITDIRELVLEKIIKPINHDSRFEPTEDLIKELVYLWNSCSKPIEFVYDKEYDFMYLGTIDSTKTYHIDSSKTYHILDIINNIIYKNVTDVNTRNDLISRTGYTGHSKWIIFWHKGSIIYVSENKLTLNFNGYLDFIKNYINSGDKRLFDNVTLNKIDNTIELLLDTTDMEVNYKESFVSLIDAYKHWYKQNNQKELELTKSPYLVIIKDYIK